MIVADTNLLAYLTIKGTETDRARRVFQRDPEWVVPLLWRSEFLNVLATMIRTERLDVRRARKAWRTATNIVDDAEYEPDELDVLRLAGERNISAYDAQFVSLARLLGTRVVTNDKTLLRRCPDLTVSIEHYADHGMP